MYKANTNILLQNIKIDKQPRILRFQAACLNYPLIIEFYAFIRKLTSN